MREVVNNLRRYLSGYLVQGLSNVAGLVLLGGQDNVDDLGDGSLHGHGVLLVAAGPP